MVADLVDRHSDRVMTEQTSPATDGLSGRLLAHNEYFSSLMELIPSEYYFPKEEVDDQSWKSKYLKNTKKPLEMKAIKKQLKKSKFDPSSQKTNAQIQAEKVETEKAKKETEQTEMMEDTEEGPIDVEAVRKSIASKIPSLPEDALAVDSNENLSAIEKLRQRLHARIEAIRQKRKSDDPENEHKGKRDRSRKRQRDSGKNAGEGQNPHAKKQKPNNDGSKVTDKKANDNKEVACIVPVVEAAKIEYGSLLLGDENKHGKKKGKQEKGLKGLQNLIKKAEEKKKRLEELKQSTKENEKTAVEKAEWSSALKLARGEKVKDDPKLLKKTLKRKLKQKEKSAKDWKKRTDAVMADKAEKQRQKISRMRGSKKKDTKSGPQSSGGNRAGFEGKKGPKFLNEEKK